MGFTFFINNNSTPNKSVHNFQLENMRGLHFIFLGVLVLLALNFSLAYDYYENQPLRYRKRTERCFRRAGAMSRYYLDQKAVDINKMVKCLRKVDKPLNKEKNKAKS